jgi:hypothetical protein
MTLKERLRARGAPKLQWAFALLAAWAFFVEVVPKLQWAFALLAAWAFFVEVRPKFS